MPSSVEVQTAPNKATDAAPPPPDEIANNNKDDGDNNGSLDQGSGVIDMQQGTAVVKKKKKSKAFANRGPTALPKRCGTGFEGVYFPIATRQIVVAVLLCSPNRNIITMKRISFDAGGSGQQARVRSPCTRIKPIWLESPQCDRPTDNVYSLHFFFLSHIVQNIMQSRHSPSMNTRRRWTSTMREFLCWDALDRAKGLFSPRSCSPLPAHALCLCVFLY